MYNYKRYSDHWESQLAKTILFPGFIFLVFIVFMFSFLSTCLVSISLPCFLSLHPWYAQCKTFSFYILSIWVFYCMYVCAVCVLGEGTGQKRTADALEKDSCEPRCASWTQNHGPVEKQPVLLSSESSLQPPNILLNEWLPVCSLHFL